MASINSLDDGKDETVGAIAVGFSLGFGFLTVWEAIKQTRRSKNPRRSPYIAMVWGELLANIIILILGYLFFKGVLTASVPVFFFILLAWVFQIQLLMQIIINRISIISETQSTIRKLKWGTALIISAINVAVFCIFIPAHIEPPVSQTFVNINRYWDRISKVLICLVDAALNYYFLRVVKQRLVDQYGLKKYEPLVSFNARLMFISVLLDVLLIGLMSLPNQEVFILFHPVVYLSKMNIEMTMASLIVKLARTGRADAYFHHSSTPHANDSNALDNNRNYDNNERDLGLKTFTESRIRASVSGPRAGDGGSDVPQEGIQRTREFQVTVHHSSSGSMDDDIKGSITTEDEAWLTSHAGHPTA
ncbi:hypothetical protein N0V93_010202 [Gnomoniopsis smithogilvyi]|uniref:Uncharacterized protein n=1 Tax=Gnomoniopsis smithogilvyi TaxID=1191159 RepID=A0A9W8YKR8_9PEZI|nr:hypothetical protein N0V93_010202 [Gnomoniopsis smithogilvyi]